MSITETIPSLGTVPTTDDPANFDARADALFGTALPAVRDAINTFSGQANALGAQATSDAAAASTSQANSANSATAASISATAASDSSTAASSSSTAAAASAASAAAIAGAFVGTSTTSISVSIGSKTFTTQSGEQYTSGIYITAVSDADASNFMFGQVTSYSGTTLVLDVQVTSGSGTYSDWNLSLTGARGAPGTAGAGITPQSVGFTLTGGTSSKTLTVLNDGTAAILGANTFTDTQNLADNNLERAMIIDSGLVYLNKGNSGTTTQDLAYIGGSHQKITATGAFTITTSLWPPTGNLGIMLLEATDFGAHTVTWPTINWILPDGTTTTTISTWLAANTGRTAFQSSGTDFLVLYSRDSGTTIYGKFA
jgi:hypothetical protein